jgi:dTMP kinase
MKTEKELFAGKLITVEGIDGSGKSTLVDSLEKYLVGKGHKVMVVRDPGSTPINTKLREILKEGVGGDRPTAISELTLFMTCRHELNKKVIGPALSLGHVVITDRYQLSTDTYQGIGLDLQEPLMRLKEVFTIREPDCTLIVDVELEVASERIGKREPDGHDWIESRDMEYYNKVRDGFLAVSEKKGHFLIDGSQEPEVVLSDATFIINNYIGTPAVNNIRGVLDFKKNRGGVDENHKYRSKESSDC